MKIKTSAFGSDVVYLSWWDIWLLVIGKPVRDGACILWRGRVGDDSGPGGINK